MSLDKDLRKCLFYMDSYWSKQTNILDKQTGFVYDCETLDDCLQAIEKENAPKEYALHRWYNHKTSSECEHIFCEFGAVPDPDKYNHDVDIYIDNVPFDVKLTVYPQALSKTRPFNISTRQGKNDMIKWLYENQSQEKRKQLINRLYIVCDGKNAKDNLILKSNFSLIRERISNFMNYYKEHGKFNEITIEDNGNQYTVLCDIIVIK